MKTLFYIEITDTYGGEANYSWVTRYIIRAKSERGAINALSRRYGLSWHNVDRTWEYSRYDSKSGATCCFISEYEKDCHANYCFATDDRKECE